MPPRRSDFQPKPLRDRWEAKVERTPFCWEWRGARDNNGYGKIQSGEGTRKVLYAHRVAYELYVGPIPEGKHLDHLICDNRGCVNPAHLAAVTPWENVRRANGWTAQRARATECIHGHEFTPENTRRTSHGHRSCRECEGESDRKRGPRRQCKCRHRREDHLPGCASCECHAFVYRWHRSWAERKALGQV